MLETQALAESLTDTPQEEAAPGFPAADTAQRIGTVGVVGLGYVGLPVAIAFGKERPTIGYDLSTKKIHQLRQFVDPTGEVASDELKCATHLTVTDDPDQPAALRDARPLLGLATWATERALRETLAAEGLPGARTAVIGPAGEHGDRPIVGERDIADGDGGVGFG